MPDDTQLDRIEGKIDRLEGKIERVEDHLKTLNGSVASHRQTLHGAYGHGGLVDDVRALFEKIKPSGTVSTKTMWSAIAALSAVVAVLLSLVIGLT